MNQQTLPPDVQRARNRRNIVLIALIAFVPAVVAYSLLIFFPQYIPKGTTNKGTLIRPAITIDDLSDGGRIHFPTGDWMLMVPAGADCNQACQHALYLTRQTNIALGKNADRVERLLLVSGNHVSKPFNGLLEKEYPHMLIQYLAPGEIQRVLGRFATKGTLDGTIFMVDPEGFIMMYYTPKNSGKDILSDLKHLLGVTG